ncbi:hypothetical protein FACS1894167_06810 [Synergistales bacterium]|nr:hypothetical protein FACS1894167_06810 [Synergistales bacterium]
MIDTKRKEELSKSYLNAVCAVKGIAMEVQGHDDDGIDVILQKSIHRKDGHPYNARIGVQLKSTTIALKQAKGKISYPLEKKNYDDLRRPATIKPYLFLLILPKDEKEWIQQSVEELIIRKCMYWIDLKFEFPHFFSKTNPQPLLPQWFRATIS